MVLSYYGLSCFKIQSGDSTIAIDPANKAEGTKQPRFEAGYAIFTDEKNVSGHSLAGAPVIFSTPGEYDINGITIIGFETGEPHVPFFIEIEGIRILHTGNIGKAAALEPIIEHLGTIDILLISAPSSVSETEKIIKWMDPRIIVPMQGTGSKKLFDELIKDFGKKPETMDKLSIKKKALPADNQLIIVLKPMLS